MLDNACKISEDDESDEIFDLIFDCNVGKS